MRKLFLVLLFAGIIFSRPAFAQDDSMQPVGDSLNIPADAYYKAEVTAITDQQYLGTDPDKQVFQTLRVRILSGDEQGQEITIDNVGGININGGHGFAVGDKIVVNKTTVNGEAQYYVQDIYRVPALLWLSAIFLLVVLVFSRFRGLMSIVGLGVTVIVILKFIAPQIMAGKNPLEIVLIGASVITLASLYLAHGFNKRTSIAVLSTLLTLGLAVGIAYWFVHFSRLFGNGSEESVYLQFNQTQNINLQGLLLAGIILGALGVLDDITTAQSATVDELKKANPALGFTRLYRGAASVGREHISSLINTLFLAYAGVALPLFLLLTANNTDPIWVTVNSEFIAEEIVRTLIGSVVLILAVPLTTLLAAYFFSRRSQTENKT
jgi:uncharacterized membrane protein